MNSKSRLQGNLNEAINEFAKSMVFPLVMLTVLVFGLSACNRNAAPEVIEPAGAIDGHNTFIFLFTETCPPFEDMEPIVNGSEAQFSAHMAFEHRNAVAEDSKTVMPAFSLRGQQRVRSRRKHCRPSQTVCSIGANITRFGVPVSAMLRTTFTGMAVMLVLAVARPLLAHDITHIVQQGETLSGIAQQYGYGYRNPAPHKRSG